MAGLSIPGKVVPPQNWHITLRFIGTIDEVALDRLVAGLDELDLGPRFEVVFGALGAFPRSTRATVLWRAITDRTERLPRTGRRRRAGVSNGGSGARGPAVSTASHLVEDSS